jgi:hypothetical protein
MDAISMLRTAVILFALTAVLGVVMAGIRFARGANPPAWVSLVHGLLAGSALTLVLYAAFVVGVPASAKIGLGLLLAASAGGLVMNLGYHWKDRLDPASIVVLHALLAVAGFILLVLAAFGS